MAEHDIDGALVGGASLDPASFAAIVDYSIMIEFLLLTLAFAGDEPKPKIVLTPEVQPWWMWRDLPRPKFCRRDDPIGPSRADSAARSAD